MLVLLTCIVIKKGMKNIPDLFEPVEGFEPPSNPYEGFAKPTQLYRHMIFYEREITPNQYNINFPIIDMRF